MVTPLQIIGYVNSEHSVAYCVMRPICSCSDKRTGDDICWSDDDPKRYQPTWLSEHVTACRRQLRCNHSKTYSARWRYRIAAPAVWISRSKPVRKLPFWANFFHSAFNYRRHEPPPAPSIIITTRKHSESSNLRRGFSFYSWLSVNKKAQLSLTNPRDACEKFARFT